MPMPGWRYGRCGPSCFHPDCDCKPEWFEEKLREALTEDLCEYCGRSEGHNEVCIMNEVMRLRDALKRLDRIFTYPVSKDIDPKGYRQRPVQTDTISLAVETIRAALPHIHDERQTSSPLSSKD